jgi:hypothetical protein
VAVIEQQRAPYVRDRGFGFNGEIHINETPMDLWAYPAPCSPAAGI